MTKTMIGIGAVIGVGLVIWIMSLSAKPEESSNTQNSNVAVANANALENGNTNLANTSNPEATPTAARYVGYSAAAETEARQSGGQTVLYFHADWCPVCQVLDPSIRANLDDLPDGLTILKVNYDNETELKRKYGVTYQHTFVQIDNNANKLKLWSGSNDAREIADQLI